jgi:decaprenylphospho-beta-D-erythro-pentofuranosid-2-ulose 2-reductase
MRMQHVVVFGATSAIAQAVLRLLVADSASVFCVGRSETRLAALLADLRVRAGPGQVVDGIVADLVRLEEHVTLFDAAVARLGEIDAMLIAHGSLPSQADCEVSVERTLLAVAENATSVASLLTVAAGYFERQGRGVIAVISSVAGDRGRRSNYVYGASKSFVSTFTQGLRLRLADRGVDVVTIKPGLVDTPMTEAITPKGMLWSSPERVAQAIVKAMDRGVSECYTPRFWFWIMLVLRHLPEAVFRRLKL